MIGDQQQTPQKPQYERRSWNHRPLGTSKFTKDLEKKYFSRTN